MTSPLTTPEPWELVADAYADEAVPAVFVHFAEAALRLADLPPAARVVDVACGPGTLALAAAPLSARVAALDFSPAMIARVVAAGAPNVEARVGDGQALPWPDASFDRAFSLFGLMFFPDRTRGFRELARVLAPGGKAVVSSWVPLAEVPQLLALVRALTAMLPEPPAEPPPLALASAGDIVAEMEAGGFRDVNVHEIGQTVRVATTAELWSSFERTNAPAALVRRRLGPRWPELATRALAGIEAALGPGPHEITMRALFGVATVR